MKLWNVLLQNFQTNIKVMSKFQNIARLKISRVGQKGATYHTDEEDGDTHYQWRNMATVTPDTLEGAEEMGHQIVVKCGKIVQD